MRKYSYKQRISILLILICFQLSVQAQTISGVVKDAETQHPLDFCNILILKSTVGTTTDAIGKFKITLPKNITTPKLVISFLGYKSDTIKVSAPKSNYEILLKPKQGTLNEVVVTGVSKAVLVRENPIAIISVSAKAIENTTETNIIDMP